MTGASTMTGASSKLGHWRAELSDTDLAAAVA
jgi:hypothetical protein